MSGFFIGAYVEIECNKMTVEHDYWTCPNQHAKEHGWYPKPYEFCPTCGQPITLQSITKQVYPTMIVDHILPEEWEDVLQTITPYDMHGHGRILATWNGNPDVGVYAWLHEESGPAVHEIPTYDDMERIKQEFAEGYDPIIRALWESPLVREMNIKFGIVRMEEY